MTGEIQFALEGSGQNVAEVATPIKESPVVLPKKRGRPPGSAQPKQEPPAEDKHLTIAAFLKLWTELYAEHQGRYLVYVWRREPILIKAKPLYEDILERPVTEEQLETMFGAGEYKLILNDKDKPKYGAVATCVPYRVDRPWSTHPPKLDYKCLDMQAPRNQTFIKWAQNEGKFEMTSNPAAAADTAAVPALVGMMEKMLAAMQKGQPVDTTGTRVAEMFSEASSKAIDIALQQVTKNSPEDTLKLITAIQTAFKQEFGIKEVLNLVDRLKPGDQPKDPRVDMLVEELKASRLEAAEARKRSDTLMDKLFEERTNRPQDTFTQTLQEKLMTRAIDLLDGGGARAAGKFAWLAEYLPGILDTVKPVTQGLGILIQRAANRNGTSAPPAQPGTALPPGPQVIPDYVQQGANPDPSQLSPEQVQMALSNFFLTVGPPLRKHLMEGKTGQEFADFLMQNGYLDMQGFNQLKEIGRDNLMGILRQMPAAWANIQPIEKRFTEFLDEFLSWDPNWGTQEPGPQEPEWLRRKQ